MLIVIGFSIQPRMFGYVEDDVARFPFFGATQIKSFTLCRSQCLSTRGIVHRTHGLRHLVSQQLDLVLVKKLVDVLKTGFPLKGVFLCIFWVFGFLADMIAFGHIKRGRI